MTYPQTIDPSQANKETVISEDLRTLRALATFGPKFETISGLTYHYHGTGDGQWGGFTVADGSQLLGASTTTYMVVAIASGAVSFSTATTNWNDSTNYARCFALTTSASGITTYADHREGSGGAFSVGSGGAGSVTSVNGATGAVVLDSFDIEHTDPSGRFGSPSTVGNAIEELAAAKMFEWSGMIETPEHNKTYTLVLKVPFAGTIHETTTDCASGSGTARFKIEGVNLGGTINTVTTSEQSQTHNSANVFSSGNTISMTMTSDSPSLIDYVFSVRYSRFV